MKDETLLQLLGDIDDDLIADAAIKSRRITPHRIVACAAAVLLLIAVTLLPFDKLLSPDIDTLSTSPTTSTTQLQGLVTVTRPQTETTEPTKSQTTEPTKSQTTTTTTTAPTTTVTLPEIALIPKWEEKTLSQKFPEAIYDGNAYSVTLHTLEKSFVGKELGSVTMHGNDVYTDTDYHTTATLYQIADIATDCAVAVRYEGVNAYYSALHISYRPDTLGEFLTDLPWERYLDVGAVYLGNTSTPTDHLLSKKDLFDLLLDDRTLPNIHDDRFFYQGAQEVLSVSAGVPVLGIENVSLSVTADGYLHTNILGSGNCFFVGEERVKALFDHLGRPVPTTTAPPKTSGGTTTRASMPPRTAAERTP